MEQTFYDFLVKNRDEILSRCFLIEQDKLIYRSEQDTIKRGLPVIFDEFVNTYKTVNVNDIYNDRHLRDMAGNYGKESLKRGVSIYDVIETYASICEAITGLAIKTNFDMNPKNMIFMNMWLDAAMAKSAQVFDVRKSDEKTREIQKLKEEQDIKIGEMIHELKRDLSRAILSLDILKMGKVGIKSRTGEILGSSLDKLRKLIDTEMTQLLFRVQYSPSLEQLDVISIIDESTGTLKNLADRRRIKIDYEIKPGTNVTGDRQLLTSAITNLEENAIKYTHTGGKVTIKAEEENGKIKIEVLDECGGVSEDKIENILKKPFVRGSVSSQGTGLGLNIAKNAVEKENGELSFRNMPGKGCIFSVLLPEKNH